MSRPLLIKYTTLQAILISPIAPHWAEHIWLSVLHQHSSIQNALWPTDVTPPSPALSAARTYVKTTSSNIASAETAASKKAAKGKNVAFDPKKPKQLTVYLATNFPAWQDKYVEVVRQLFESSTINGGTGTSTIDDKALNASVGRIAPKPEIKKAMPFVQSLKKRLTTATESPTEVFSRVLPFDEHKILSAMLPVLKKNTGCVDVQIVTVKDESQLEKNGGPLPNFAESAVPGQPSFHFENV